MKLIIIDQGDLSVGLFPQGWIVMCPFEELGEEADWFKEKMIEIYKEFCNGKIEAYYER